MNPSETLSLFFEKIWGDNEGYVYLPNRSPEKAWHKVFWQWPKDSHKIVQYVLHRTSINHEVFFAPAIYREPTVASQNNVKGSQVLWADFDGDDGTPSPEDWEKLGGNVVEPTVRVQTSTSKNEHVYWVLDKFVEDLDFIESKNRSIAYTLGSDPACWNANRLLRPPSSINFGYTKPERQGKIFDVTIKEYSDRVYNEVDFSHFKPIRTLVKESLIHSERPSVEDIMMDCLWTDSLKKLFKKSVNELGKDKSGALVSLAAEAAELGWNDQQIYTLICDADDRWGKYRDRSDRDFLRASTLDWVRRKIPYSNIELDFSGLLASTEVSPQLIYTYGEFRKLNIQIDWIIEGLLTSKGYVIVFGQPGIGKTQFGIQLARAIASGTDFLLWSNTSRPRKVMLFSLEMGDTELKSFTDTMDVGIEEGTLPLIDENLLIAPLGEDLPLDKSEGKKFFEQTLSEYKPEVVLIDSLGAMTGGDLMTDEPARKLNRYVQYIRKTYSCAVVVIHHTNKANQGSDLTLSDLYGNTYLYNKTDSVIGLARTKDDDTLRVSMCKVRLSKTPRSFDIVRELNLSFTYTEGEISDAPRRSRRRKSEPTDLYGFEL